MSQYYPDRKTYYRDAVRSFLHRRGGLLGVAAVLGFVIQALKKEPT